MSLSIFNFSFLKEIRVVALFAALFFASFYFSGTLLYKVDPHSPIISFETAAIGTYNSETEVLFLGNSHFYSGINTEWIQTQKAAQLSSSAIDYTYQKMLLDHFIDRMPNLKAIVMQVSRQPLDDNTFKIRTGDFRLFFQIGISAFDLPHSSIVDQIKLYPQSFNFIDKAIHGPKLTFQNLKNYLKGSPKTKSYPFPLKPAFLPVDNVYKPSHQEVEALEAYKAQHPTGPIQSSKKDFRGPYDKEEAAAYYENLNSFKDLLTRFKTMGLKVYLLRTPIIPAHQTYELGIQDLLEAADQITSYTLIDLYNSEIFDPEDFKDARHLNVKGAKKLTLYLDKVLSQ